MSPTTTIDPPSGAISPIPGIKMNGPPGVFSSWPADPGVPPVSSLSAYTVGVTACLRHASPRTNRHNEMDPPGGKVLAGPKHIRVANPHANPDMLPRIIADQSSISVNGERRCHHLDVGIFNTFD